jgi:hypothetical protein
MNPSNYRVRRATTDDLTKLRPIWATMQFPAGELERRVTEFQLAENADGQMVGAVGFQMLEGQARIHSEAFSDFAVADFVRPLFWDRIRILAANHGITRLWTREDAPFWKQNGLQPAVADVLKKLPAAWSEPNAAWLTLQLKGEEAIASIEKEIAMLMKAERQRTARTLQHAETLKKIGLVLAIIFGIFVLGALLYLVNKYPGSLNLGR